MGNMSKLNKIFTEIKDEEDRSRLEVSWEDNRNGANDSLALPAYKKIQSTIEVLEKSYKEMTVIEKNNNKGVTWKDLETDTQEEKEEIIRHSDITYVMENDNYRSALKMVSDALETLLEMKIDTVNMEYMETIVRFIVSLCLEYNINTGDIQENMLEMGRYIREYQEASKHLEFTQAENERLASEVKHQGVIMESYKAMCEGYKKFAAGNLKGSKGDGEELAKRMIGLEKELEDTTDKYKQMLLKYSFAYGRKDEYKDCYYNLKKAYEKDKKKFAEQKKTLEENELAWKNKAEYEESQKLKQTIENKLTQRKMETADERSTEMIIEFNKLKLQHEAELYNLIKNHEKEMTEEKKMKDLMEKNIVIKDTEINKQKKHYGEKMKEMRAKLSKALIDEAAIVRDLAN